MLFMPDSPLHLVKKGKSTAAREALVRLRGSQCTYIDEELETINRQVEASKGSSSASLKKLFTSGVYLKPFGVSMGLMFFQQFCGINGVLFYLQKVFLKAGSTLDSGLEAFLVGLAQASATDNPPIFDRFFFTVVCVQTI